MPTLMLVRRLLPPPVLHALRFMRARSASPFDVRRRRRPLGEHWERGLPIDRYYVEAFLERHRDDIHGRVLEVADPSYTERYGGSRVTRSDVLHAVPGNPRATIVGDLVSGSNIPVQAFDCMIMTQLYLCIFDVHAAIATTHAVLKPGGVVLVTLPSISQVSRYDADRWGDFWRFTDMSAHRLFGDVFGAQNVTVESRGNVLSACAFLYALGAHELTEAELNDADPDYPVVIGVRAVKAS